MGVVYKIVGQGEAYTDKATGKEKRRSLDLGIVIQTANGLMIKMNAIPVGWDGWAYLNEPEQQQSRGQQRQPQGEGYSRGGVREPAPQQQGGQRGQQNYRQQRHDGFEDDDIPFIRAENEWPNDF